MFTAASLPRRVGAARPRIFVHTTGPNQGSGESKIRQRTVDTQDRSPPTNKFSEEYVLNYRCGS